MSNPSPESTVGGSETVNGLSPDSMSDLRRSGLSDATIRNEGIAGFNEIVDTATLRGYRIPYYDVKGESLSGYGRRRMIPAHPDKYLAPPGSGSHLYIPASLQEIDPKFWKNFNLPIFVCEGEKKALAVAQLGFLAVGVSGSSAWRSSSIAFELDVIQALIKKAEEGGTSEIHLHLTNDQITNMKKATKVVDELEDIVWDGRDVYVAFDMDNPLTRRKVQSEALSFAFWLDEQGAKVHTIILPTADTDDEKIGIDDYLVMKGMSHLDPQNQGAIDALLDLMNTAGTLPVLENLKTWIANHLANASTDMRRRHQQVSRAVLAAIDSSGKRYVGRGDDGLVNRVYYHDTRNDDLMMLFSSSKELRDIANLKLGAFLNQQYAIQSQDTGIISRFADDFKTIEPFFEVSFYRGMANKHNPDAFYLQLDSTSMVKVNAEGITRIAVGEDGIVFEIGSTEIEPLLWEHLEAAIQYQEQNFDPSKYWFDTLGKFNFNPMADMDMAQTRTIYGVNAYISPALWRWRGSFLPNEVLVCEPDSGKSSLYKIRNIIWTGNEHLTAPPEDVRTWKANLANAVGMFCVDNVHTAQGPVQNTIRELINQISTSETASLKERRMYTNTGEDVIKISTPFAFTSVGMTDLFNKQDFLQRSLPLTMNRYTIRDSNFVQRIEESRTEWVAHHLVALRRFFALVNEKWDAAYQANHRLDNYEQIMVLMAEILGVREVLEPAIKHLQFSAERAFEYMMPIFNAYKEFCQYHFIEVKNQNASTRDIKDWVEAYGRDYARMAEFRTTTSIGQWLRNNKAAILATTGMEFVLGEDGSNTSGHLLYKRN